MHTPRRIVRPGLLVLVVVLAAGAGCRDTTQAPPTMRQDPLGGNYPRHVAIAGLDHALVVEEPIVDASTATRPMSVTVPVRSVVDEPLSLQYRFRFLDERGRDLHDSGWRLERLEPRLQANLEANARQTAAADWRLEIRPER
ncbi:MAG: DUF1425 domain-containing protein [Phycisphaeraceae bacterium]